MRWMLLIALAVLVVAVRAPMPGAELERVRVRLPRGTYATEGRDPSCLTVRF